MLAVPLPEAPESVAVSARLDLRNRRAYTPSFSASNGQVEPTSGCAMRCRPGLFTAAAFALALAGCVERRYVVYTDPPGAMVLRNGVPLTASPADDFYEYYGKYHFTIIAEGYETLQVDQAVAAPWYEFPPLDFISENVIPWKILDRREFTYHLQPRIIANTDKLLSDGQNLRNRGISLGGGSALPAPAAPAASPNATPPAPVAPAPPAQTPANPSIAPSQTNVVPSAPGGTILSPPTGSPPTATPQQ